MQRIKFMYKQFLKEPLWFKHWNNGCFGSLFLFIPLTDKVV